MKVLFSIFLVVVLGSCSEKGELGVRFTYSPALDSICSFFNGPNISAEWKEELGGKKAELEREWKAIGETLISSTEQITGHRLDANDKTVHLTLCNTTSRSFPLILNMRYALSSYTDNPVSIKDKVGTVYHELLHPYIDSYPPEFSTELKKYENENSRVLKHIHLLTLVKAVYLSLNLEQQLSSILKMDSSLPNGDYKRAWEIVNSSESYYKVLVAELAKP